MTFMTRRFLKAKARAREQLGAPMFPPGRIAFLRHLKAPGRKGDWDAVWIGNEARPGWRTLNPTLK